MILRNKSLPFIYSTLLLMTTVQADSTDNESPEADFLEFLAEVDEATGDGFDAWLEADTAADAVIDNDEEKK